MHWYHTLPLLLAQAADQTASAAAATPSAPWYFSPWFFYPVALLGAIVLPFLLGDYISKSLRMSDYGWKIGLIFCSLALSGLIIAPKPKGLGVGWPPKLGVDLKGGVILIYEINPGGVQLAAQEAEKAGDKKAKEGEEDEAAEAGVADPADEIRVTDLIEALRRRLNPGGVKEIVIRPYGERQVEIIVPEVEDAEIQRIKDLITKAGFLTFRIVATMRDHEYLIDLAARPENKDAAVIKDDNRVVGFWAGVAREDKKVGGVLPLQVDVRGDIIRDAATKEWIRNLPEDVVQSSDTVRISQWLEEQGHAEIDVLMAADDGFNVEGKHLASVRSGFDEYVNPCINFDMTIEGSSLFGGLTGSNLPDQQTDFHRRLGILLDDELLSAPRILSTISSSGRITGKFTQEEVDFLVGILRAGRLPAALNKTPLSENRIDPLLGRDTIEKGFRAIVISLVAVLVFMAFYYRFAGVVACLALVINLVLIVGTMIMVNAAFTLPGLAGLVLTVGMSVDANVLIYERIREELTRGSALRMAIRNGFSRATTTIVDANVTTLITAIVLYAIGTDQIRGFAVTLVLGIVMSMYTAIFCSRVVFDIYERKWKATKLPMNRILGATEIDFMGKAKIAIAVSLVVIVVGLAGVVVRGKNIFDIDFNGGVSVTMVLNDPMETDQVRTRLNGMFAKLPGNVQFTLTSYNDVSGQRAKTVYKIDASLVSDSPEEEPEEKLKEALQAEFRNASGTSMLKSYSLELGPLKTITVAAASPAASATPEMPASPAAPATTETTPPEKTPPADKPTEPAPASPATTEPSEPAPSKPAPSGAPADQPKPSEPSTPAEPKQSEEDEGSPSDGSNKSALRITRNEFTFVAFAEDEPTESQPANDESPPATEAEPKEPAPDDENAAANEAAPAAETTPEEPKTSTTTESELENGDTPSAPTDVITRVETTLNFGDHKINVPTLRDMIQKAAAEIGVTTPDITLVPEPPDPNWQVGSEVGYVSWKLTMVGDEQRAQAILKQLESEVDGTSVWPSSSKIGSLVAGRMQSQAVAALVFSIIGIVIYIWIRFQRAIFGLAAVIALVHDVLIMLGAIAVSAWLKDVFGILLIEEFKISLPVVAAFLTIIGYSLNDTIVVFDRIREVRGKSPDLTAEMINTSINQTLSRTLLTSFTTFIVVLILYALGGQGIHGFAFALVIGVVAGTYSSVFIAAPVLLWIMGTKKPVKEKSLVA